MAWHDRGDFSVITELDLTCTSPQADELPIQLLCLWELHLPYYTQMPTPAAYLPYFSLQVSPMLLSQILQTSFTLAESKDSSRLPFCLCDKLSN